LKKVYGERIAGERREALMQKSSFQEWLSTQEYKRPSIIFMVEWLALFGMAWLFWWVIFFGGRGSVQPGLAASLTSGLYATCLIYGRLLRVTGCRKCANPMPFLRREVGRRHVGDHEECFEVQSGEYEWGQYDIQVYSRMVRTDIVTYRCRKCRQAWEEKSEVPASSFRPMRRMDTRK
jgi:hypothetical protein